MDQDTSQTELQTALDEIGLSDASYERALDGLNFIDLKEECMRQYHLSGEMLNKYRIADTKLSETRKFNNELRRSNSLMNNALAYAQRDVNDLSVELQSVAVMIELSGNYTHAMKRTVFTMIKEITGEAVHKLGQINLRVKDEIDGNSMREIKNRLGVDEIPF